MIETNPARKTTLGEESQMGDGEFVQLSLVSIKCCYSSRIFNQDARTSLGMRCILGWRHVGQMQRGMCRKDMGYSE